MTNMSFAPPALDVRNYSRTIAILSFLVLTRSSDVKRRYTVHMIINTSSQWPCPRTWNTRPRTPVTAISLDERHTGVHTSHTTLRPRHLSIVREELVRKINEYAKRGTLYVETYRRTCRSSLWWRIGVNRDSRFIQRARDIIHWSFSSYKKLGHLQANTPETRRSFRRILRVFLVVLKTD